jgi:mRNA interferase MazF
MNAQDRCNSERYPDMTCFLALRNIERNERKERRSRMKENWIYRRGDVYLANLDPYIGSEQGGTRPVVVLQNNTGNYYCPTLIVAPITSKAGKKPSQPTHYYAERIHGLELPGMVLLEQIKTIDKRRVKKYLGRMTRQQMDEIGEAIEEALGLYVPEEMEAP